MAVRPIFVPKSSGGVGVEEKMLEFHWHPGMAKSQRQKSVEELHKTAKMCSVLSGIRDIKQITRKGRRELKRFQSLLNNERREADFYSRDRISGQQGF